jgi:ABC-type lipoprotein export system ATPase subunit
MLSYFKLPEYLWDIYPNTFSGGERLRLNLRPRHGEAPPSAVARRATASLDNKTKGLVKEMLIRLKGMDTSMIGIFHDLEFYGRGLRQGFQYSGGGVYMIKADLHIHTTYSDGSDTVGQIIEMAEKKGWTPSP